MDMPLGMDFTSDWFSHNIPTWEKLWPMMKPRRVLEIGSYEGRSTVWMINKLASIEGAELHCIDPWEYEGGHVERRFKANVAGALVDKSVPKVVAYKKRCDLVIFSLEEAVQSSCVDDHLRLGGCLSGCR